MTIHIPSTADGRYIGRVSQPNLDLIDKVKQKS